MQGLAVFEGDFVQNQFIAKNRHIFLMLFTGIGFIALSTLMLTAQSDGVSAQTDSTPVQNNDSLIQSNSSFSIRVEAREVEVPVFVGNNKYVERARIFGVHGEVNPNTEQREISGLTVKDLHIFEDGFEQSIKNLRVELINSFNVPDNLRRHFEYSATARGYWSGSDTEDLLSSYHSVVTYPPLQIPIWWYLISYVPPPSTEGKCHKIKVTVDRDDTTVYARDEYCNIAHSSSDPLKGMDVEKKMAVVLASSQVATLPLAVQEVATFNNSGAGLINIAVEFPWSALKKYQGGCNDWANVAILGLVYNEDGTLAARFSDVAYSPKVWDSKYAGFCMDTKYTLPIRYETQLDLSPGNHKLLLVLTDGENFGHVNAPLNVQPYDQNKLSVSGIVLCKRFVEMLAWRNIQNSSWPMSDQSTTWKDKKSTAPEYHPLVSKEFGFTPTGDTVFHKKKHNLGDRMFSYFEVYEPALVSGQAKVQYEMRVIDAKTDKTIVDTGLRSADSYVNPGKLIIPIAEEIAIDKLPIGAYRIEVQASDSAGKQTP
jgi:hypothetical protein